MRPPTTERRKPQPPTAETAHCNRRDNGGHLRLRRCGGQRAGERARGADPAGCRAAAQEPAAGAEHPPGAAGFPAGDAASVAAENTVGPSAPHGGPGRVPSVPLHSTPVTVGAGGSVGRDVGSVGSGGSSGAGAGSGSGSAPSAGAGGAAAEGGAIISAAGREGRAGSHERALGPRERAARRERRLREAARQLEGCLPALSSFDRQVIVLRGGLHGRRPLSRTGTAQRLNVDAGRVQSAERSGLAGLRKADAQSGCGLRSGAGRNAAARRLADGSVPGLSPLAVAGPRPRSCPPTRSRRTAARCWPPTPPLPRTPRSPKRRSEPACCQPPAVTGRACPPPCGSRSSPLSRFPEPGSCCFGDVGWPTPTATMGQTRPKS